MILGLGHLNKISYFSHMTKSNIFKYLNFKKKNRLQILLHIVRKPFDAPKIIFKTPWLETVITWTIFKKQRVEVHIYDRAAF